MPASTPTKLPPGPPPPRRRRSRRRARRLAGRRGRDLPGFKATWSFWHGHHRPRKSRGIGDRRVRGGLQLKLVMLARSPSLYTHRRIVEVAQARGHNIDVINTLRVHMNITSSKLTLWHGGRMLAHYDAVIPRIGASITHYGLAVLRQFEMQGVFPLNESVAIGRSRDKLRALQLLAREGIGLP